MTRAIGAAVMDAGYYSEPNTAASERRGIDAHVATERLKHNEKIASAPRGRIPDGLSARGRMARKLRTEKGRSRYAQREGMIEPIFGQLKVAADVPSAQPAEAMATWSGGGVGGVIGPGIASKSARGRSIQGLPGGSRDEAAAMRGHPCTFGG